MSREIICADSLEWLPLYPERVGSIIASMPDAEEMPEVDDWPRWFMRAVRLMIRTADPDLPVIIYQTDRKGGGRWQSKAAIAMVAADSIGAKLLWHKIVLRREVGAVDSYRPGYSSMVAFSMLGGPGKASPDVMERGAVAYQNAIGAIPARLAIEFCLAGKGAGRPICDPFCGRGTIPAMADAMGAEAIGIDIDPDQCAYAERLTLDV